MFLSSEAKLLNQEASVLVVASFKTAAAATPRRVQEKGHKTIFAMTLHIWGRVRGCVG